MYVRVMGLSMCSASVWLDRIVGREDVGFTWVDSQVRSPNGRVLNRVSGQRHQSGQDRFLTSVDCLETSDELWPVTGRKFVFEEGRLSVSVLNGVVIIAPG